MSKPNTSREALAIAAKFNARAPEGTLVRYWRGARDGQPSGEGKTRSEAYLLGFNPVVLIEGCSGCIALTHVEIVGVPA